MSRNAHNNKNGKNRKISPTTTWRPMQMRRQGNPLVKPANLANLANLAKMANRSKSPTIWRQFGNVVEIANNLEAHVHEQTRATWQLLSNVVAFEINILQINITSSLRTTQNSPHIPGANACGRPANRWNAMYHC